jgi:hypothetical protein
MIRVFALSVVITALADPELVILAYETGLVRVGG